MIPDGRIGERVPDLVATISFFSTEAGGRKTPVRSGYRVGHDFGFGTYNDAMYEFADRDCVMPGESVKTRLWLAAPHLQRGRLHEGLEFKVLEGPRCVAVGVITKVIRPELLRQEQSAQNHEPST